MDGRNGYFQLIIKDDGTYLKIFAPDFGCQPVTFDEINKYLSDIRLFDYDKAEVSKALVSLIDVIEIKITPAVMSIQDECLKIKISEDRMVAVGRFYAPSTGGKLMTKDDIIQTLTQANVKYGVEELTILGFLKDRKYCTDYQLAHGKAPVQGHDAEITYHFKTDLSQKPKTNEDGSVDFHNLDTISHVQKDDLLATLLPADHGTPGVDVCGNVIRPNKVINKILRHGNNIRLSEDGLQMFSDVDGHVTLTDDRVFVSDSYNIPADVGASTGDIDYNGNVIVKGNVITGFSVKAKGDIEVYGVVEGAYLEAGGQIILRRGMQGMNKGILKANSNIVSKFIENATVYAGGYVQTESVMHSNVSAKGDIVVGGRRGFVSGGKLVSRTMISVKTAGSDMGNTTHLEVGIDPVMADELKEIEKELTKLNEDKTKLIQALNLLRKKLSTGTAINDEIREYVKQLTNMNIEIETKLKDNKTRYNNLRVQMDNNTSGMVKVQDTVHAGTKIVISNVVYIVKDKVIHSRFIRDGADIKIVPY
ncbi:MAG TPA: DUF342 domain-containing protein [Clostridiales bacterium]|nr:DUF342 domain-containing protein [Clostridiales bacterium]